MGQCRHIPRQNLIPLALGMALNLSNGISALRSQIPSVPSAERPEWRVEFVGLCSGGTPAIPTAIAANAGRLVSRKLRARWMSRKDCLTRRQFTIYDPLRIS